MYEGGAEGEEPEGEEAEGVGAGAAYDEAELPQLPQPSPLPEEAAGDTYDGGAELLGGAPGGMEGAVDEPPAGGAHRLR